MSADQPSFLDIEPHLRDAQRLAEAIDVLHTLTLEGSPLENEEHFLVLQILLQRLRDDMRAAVEGFDAAAALPKTVVPIHRG